MTADYLTLARHLIRAAHLDSEKALGAAALDLLNRDDSPEICYELILLLIDACACMVRRLRESSAPGAKETVTVFIDDGTSIDDVEPALRGAMRALLGAVNGDKQASQDQIAMTLEHAHPFEVAAVIATAASWIVQIAAQCRKFHCPIPEWIDLDYAT